VVENIIVVKRYLGFCAAATLFVPVGRSRATVFVQGPHPARLGWPRLPACSARIGDSRSRLMLPAGADVVPEAEISGFPLRIGAILLAPRFGADIVLRIVGDRIPVTAAQPAQRDERQQAKPKTFAWRDHSRDLGIGTIVTRMKSQ